MSDKYIIKNCPCYWHIGEDNGCSLENMKLCEDDADCVMKQIVQECRKSIKCFESNKIACPVCSDAASAELGTEILKRLDIQEVE